MPGPLAGIRVVDLTHVLNGPFCTVLLAHMGAEVIKIEHGRGDRFRYAWMPYDAKRDGWEFMEVNSNKKGILLDLKKEKGKHLFRELVKKSDVVVENFTVGVMDRLGLGYEALRKINPRIVYACSRGYGETGPYKNVRANAGSIQAITGWMDTTARLVGKPGVKGPGIGDEAAGASLCIGIVSALYNREKTGKGQKIEVSMQEAQLGFMVSPLHSYFEQQSWGAAPKPCADGYFAFHIPDMSDDLWHRLTHDLGRPELAADERFITVEDRRRNYTEFEAAVSEIVRGKTRKELWKVLREIGISCAPVITVEEAVHDEHLKERGAFVEVNHPRAGKVKVLAPWVRFSETPSAITSPSPMLGQHNREVYGTILGLTNEEIDSLESAGVIGSERVPAKA
jgi:crotonobetainyl-CoA:carnitine CoA-transferase CaiB-like acyl-CoA transferase